MGEMMEQQTQPIVVSTKSEIGTKLQVTCQQCDKSFDESYSICPYCGWTYGEPLHFGEFLKSYTEDIKADEITLDEPLEEIMDSEIADENGQFFQTFSIGSAKHDIYCDERGGLYGVELASFTIDMNNAEHLKLFNSLYKLHDDKHCRYSIKLKG